MTDIFEQLCEARYEIFSMYLIDDFRVDNGTDSDTPHVITESDYAYQLFASQGWTWGGSWTNPKDYQHFQFG